jgi:hypothetical protein
MKQFCLYCYKGTCHHHRSWKFTYSDKLRVPPVDNKAKFRKFLDDCPIFINLVAESQRPDFLKLLREVKYFNKSVNGNEWTNIQR